MMECFPGVENSNLSKVLHKCMISRKSCYQENEFNNLDGSVS